MGWFIYYSATIWVQSRHCIIYVNYTKNSYLRPLWLCMHLHTYAHCCQIRENVIGNGPCMILLWKVKFQVSISATERTCWTMPHILYMVRYYYYHHIFEKSRVLGSRNDFKLFIQWKEISNFRNVEPFQRLSLSLSLFDSIHVWWWLLLIAANSIFLYTANIYISMNCMCTADRSKIVSNSNGYF